jgi:amino acid permease/predicted transcriptional regulator
MTRELFTREEVMAGLPARRASTLLFLIESRTAHLVAQSRQAMERFLTQEAAEKRDLAFLEAFALGRDPPLRPTIQHLERHAPQWAPLVPENPRIRAATAHALGQKYAFTYQAVPGIRAALGLDEKAVQQAYQRLYRKPLETIFAPQPTPVDRLRWAWAALAGWLESLPPFWTAFALTLTETVGAGILALPIALASVGPLAGVVLLVVLGLVNVLTIASMAEAVARSGTIRYGSAFIGRLVTDYLGSVGSLILTLAVAAICLMGLLAYYVGLATTLADATPVPAWVWTALLFLIGLYFLSRESLDSTVASALLVGGINIGLILILSLLAFTHVRPANLLYVNVPLLGGRPFEPSILRLVFGIILAAYFGHLSMGNCARVVLRRDPSARSLIWGSVAAQAAAMILYCIWVLAVNGAVVPQVLANQSGTALIPLAARVGPMVRVLGSVYVVLGMGMASIHVSLGLFNLVRERLPARPQPIVVLPRRRGRLLFQQRGKPAGSPRIGLTYLGLESGELRFRLDVQLAGDTHRMEMPVSDHWDETALLDQLPDLGQRGVRLALEVLDASQESIRLRVTSPMSMTYEGEWDPSGLRMADVLALPDDMRRIVNWMVRRGEVSLAEVAAFTGQDERAAHAMLDALAKQGFVRERQGKYQVHFALRRGRQLPLDIWQALDVETDSPSPRLPLSASLLTRLGERGRFFLSASPVAVVFLLAEWLLLTDAESFSGPLGFAGVVAISLFAGIFPVLLLIASRRKGECIPGTVYRFLGHPLLTTSVYLLFLVSIFLHGLVIWQGPVERAGTLLIGVLMLVVTIVMARRGAFAPRLVVELRVGAGLAPALGDRKGRPYTSLASTRQAVFAITAGGQPVTAEVRLGYPEGEQRYQAATGEVTAPSSLRYATFQVPAEQAQELKVWAHKVTPEGDSESLPALLEVRCGDETTRFDLKLSGGQALLPLTGETCRLEITLAESSVS